MDFKCHKKKIVPIVDSISSCDFFGWMPGRKKKKKKTHLGMHTKSLNANDDELVGIDHHLQEFWTTVFLSPGPRKPLYIDV